MDTGATQTQSRDIETTTKPHGTASLCNLKYRISEENTSLERKKRKKGSKTSVTSSEELNTKAMAESFKLTDMITVMKEVLKDKEVLESLTCQFREDCKDMINASKKEIMEEVEEVIEERTKAFEIKNSVQDDRIAALEKWADNTEQETRNANLVIRGLSNTTDKSDEELKSYIATTLSRKLEIKLDSNDIRYVIKLGKDDVADLPIA